MLGHKLKRFAFKLEANEEKDVCLELKPEKRAAIHGAVKFPSGQPAKNALVKLFKKAPGCSPCELIPVTFAFTDECGQFLFGVKSGVEYVIKVFHYISEKPHYPPKGDCDGKCDDNEDDDEDCC